MTGTRKNTDAGLSNAERLRSARLVREAELKDKVK
jgi:hypothetical protein